MSTQLHDVLQPANIVPHSRRVCGHSYVVPYNAPPLVVCTWSNYPTLISTSSMSDLRSEISVLCPPDQLIKVHTRRQQLSLQVAIATKARSRHIARKENTCTQIHRNLSNCTPRETCIAYQDKPTSNQMLSSNILLPEKWTNKSQ